MGNYLKSIDGLIGDYSVSDGKVISTARVYIVELERKLEQEQRLNSEIKARFVKCNTCTDEMKDKCLMFSENLCEGERCEELVDLMALIEKKDAEDNVLRIVIEDRDDDNAVLGVITLIENTLEEFEKAFHTYKDENEDCWYWEGFLDYLEDLNWKFTWEEDVSVIEV